MPSIISTDRVRILLRRLRERLWIRPLVFVILSVAAAFGSKLADGTGLGDMVPVISGESVETLLSVMASSMLVIATLAVASMVAAYSSAGNTATPRSFTLVVSDDASQNALSTFIGAFIFGIVALTSVKNGYFGVAALFVLFVQTIVVFGIVIVTFVRWVDDIARLGRMGTTIDKVERATHDALKRRRLAPTLGGVRVAVERTAGEPVHADAVGYVRHVDVGGLQTWAERVNGRVLVAALPGSFAAPGRALAYLSVGPGTPTARQLDQVVEAFEIGDDRAFDDDPRFGLIVLSEIAGRALSPAVNDPGTAIVIIGTLVRLFVGWGAPVEQENDAAELRDRVEVPELLALDMFDDAFTTIARDGAGAVEVAVRLQKALQALALAGNTAMRDAAMHHSRLALQRAERALQLSHDVLAVRAAADWSASAAPRAPERHQDQ